MQKILSTKGNWHIGIMLVRVMLGVYIFRYGRELFNIDELLNFLKSINWPLPAFSGYAAKIIELVGGVMLGLGLFTRIVSVMLMIVMLGVLYVTANFDPFNGEGVGLFFLGFGHFCFAGPGKFSLDYLIHEKARMKTNLHE